MLKTFLFSISCLFFFTVSAQDTNFARSVINVLSSKVYKGRGYVDQADAKAAKYIANQFKSIGLKPVNKSFYQKVPFSVNTFPKKMTVKYNGKLLVPGQDYIVDPASKSYKFKDNIQFIDFNSLNKDDLYNQNIYILQNVLLDTFNAKFAETAAINKKKFVSDRKKTLLIQLTNDKLTWSSSYLQSHQCIILLKSHIIDRSKPAFFEIDIDAKFQPYYESKNVIGMVPGTMEKDSFVVFTAHYDHLGMMGNKTYFPGANDNASGIAMILDLAHYFSKNPQKYSVAFIAFTGEETGLLGSDHFVRNPLFPLSNIQFLINIDLMGNGEEGAMAVNGAVFKQQFNSLDSINQLNHYLPQIKIRGKAANSDHYWFSEKGVPCFFFYLMGQYPYYHDIYDKSNAVPLKNYTGAYNLFRDFAILMIPK
jgi:aminopeptidase YwaD